MNTIHFFLFHLNDHTGKELTALKKLLLIIVLLLIVIAVLLFTTKQENVRYYDASGSNDPYCVTDSIENRG